MTDATGVGVGVIFSYRSSLTTWERAGLLDRELAYLRALSEHLGGGGLLVTYGRGSTEERALEADCTPLRCASNGHGVPDPIYSLIAPWLHRRALRSCAVLRTVQHRGAWTGALAKRWLGLPLAARAGYSWSRFQRDEGSASALRRRVVRAVEGWSLRTADVVLVPSEADRDHLIELHDLPAARVVLLPNAIDTDLFRPCERGNAGRRHPAQVVFVGRLEPQKNLEPLVRAVGRSKNARLLLVGAGSQRESLGYLASRHAARVDFSGPRPNREIPALLQSARVFALPSRFEGTPKALLEAMACGLAVVAADTPSVRELVAHERTGLLVEPGEAALEAAIARVLGDPALAARLGEAARAHVLSHHGLDAVARLEARMLAALAGDAP